MRDAIHQFGAKAVGVKELLKEVEPMFAHADATVRTEAVELMVELWHWLGETIRPFLNKLRPAQIKEIEAGISKLKELGAAKPERYLRSQQEKMTRIAQSVSSNDGNDTGGQIEQLQPTEIDPYELMEAADISDKLNNDTVFEALVSPKWQVRKEQLDALIVILEGTPKLKSADFTDITKAIKKTISSDANVLVVSRAVKLAGLLAKGLRKSFSTQAKSLLPAVLDKLKEKETSS